MNTNKYRILFIEDENNIRNFVKTVLETNDYQVLTATSCQQGIMMVSSHVPDMIILDLGLPDMDGLELIRHVRHSSAVPILVLSGATLGGNCTPIGASANITGIGILRKAGHEVKNADFFKIGIPFTLAAIIPAYIYLWIFFGA